MPYTVIDDGWWYQGVCPAVPSGKTDHAVVEGLNDAIFGDGDVPVALMDKDDIGIYVAEIIADPRTINKKVFIYTEVLTLNQVSAIVGELTGEKPERKFVSCTHRNGITFVSLANRKRPQVTKDELLKRIADAKKLLEKDPANVMGFIGSATSEYAYSYAVRGDNTPEAAKYLGYLDSHELYPDVKTKSLREYFQKLVNNKPPGATKMSFEFMLKNIAGF